jgi:hypothetical protein
MGRCTYLDPPRIPLKKGDFEKNFVPPLLRGDRNSMQPHKKLVLLQTYVKIRLEINIILNNQY